MPLRSFPADGVMLDACTLIRLYKCGALERLKGLTTLHVTSQVCKEFEKDPGQRSALRRLRITKHPLRVGTAAWEVFCQVRGGLFSHQDMGEDESLAICVTEAQKDRLLPLVTFDKGAAGKAVRFGVPTMDFLSLLSWLVACGSLSYEEADALEALAAQRNGWKRPSFYQGGLEPHAEALRHSTAHAIQEWRIRLRRNAGSAKPKRRGR